MAKGEGQHLSALLNVAGCNVALHGDVTNALRSDLADAVSSEAYSSMTREEKAESLFNQLNKQASTCTI